MTRIDPKAATRQRAVLPLLRSALRDGRVSSVQVVTARGVRVFVVSARCKKLLTCMRGGSP